MNYLKYLNQKLFVYQSNNKFKKKTERNKYENRKCRIQTVYTILNIHNTRSIIDIHKYPVKIHFHFPPHRYTFSEYSNRMEENPK